MASLLPGLRRAARGLFSSARGLVSLATSRPLTRLLPALAVLAYGLLATTPRPRLADLLPRAALAGFFAAAA